MTKKSKISWGGGTKLFKFMVIWSRGQYVR